MPAEDQNGEQQVRRLLGEAGATAPMPDDVQARLDAVLADLAAGAGSEGRSQQQGPGRPRWARLAVAAAAAVVLVLAIGGGVAGLIRATGGSQRADTSASDAPAHTTPASALPSPAGTARGRTSTGPSSAAGSARSPASTTAGARPSPHRTTQQRAGRKAGRIDGSLAGTAGHSLRSDVRRLALRAPADSATIGPGSFGIHRGSGPALGPCLLPAVGRGDRLYAVRFDGHRAVLKLHPESRGSRVAQVYSCDDVAWPLAQASVPAH